MVSPVRHLYEFDRFVLDVSERLLLSRGEAVHLTPKEFETLLALVRGAGRVMPKEELLREIWPDTYVGEATLAQNVFTLRKALGEAEGGRPYIETVPRRGYRLAVKVTERREGEAPSGETSDTDAAGATNAGGTPTAGPPVEAGGLPRGIDEGAAAESPSSRHAAEEASASSRSAAVDAAGDGRGLAPTLPRRAQRDEHVPGAVRAPPPSAYSPSPSARVTEGHPVRAAILISVAVFVTVAALVYMVFRLSVRPDVERARMPAPDFQSMKVTRLPVTGSVSEAAISPDGKYLAYVASEPGRQNPAVWLRQVAAASNTQQLVAPAESTFYGGLVFSPDSAYVYYGAAREGANPPSIFRVPVLGGLSEPIPAEGLGGPGGSVAFSPDGKQLAYVRGQFGREMTLVVSDVSGANERTVVTAGGPAAFGLPAWSPDGRRVACVYVSGESPGGSTPSLGVTTFRLSDGAEERVTGARWTDVRQLSWLPDGSGLVLSAAEEELSPAQIWMLSLPSGEVRRVTNDLNTYLGASLTADGSALVTVQTDRLPNVWVAPGGDWDIWVMNADGTGQRQLTVGARSNYGPSVSADGRHIVFVSNRAGGAFNIWRMDADGSNPLRLTSGRGENFPHLTPDGRWVVYATVGPAEAAVWKVPVEGGEPVRLTDKPSSWPFVSPDGKSFVCTYGEGPFSASKLAVIPIEGGEPTRLFDVPPTFRANTVWLPDNRGIAFLDARTGTSNVWMQPLSGGRPVQLTDFTNDNVTAFDWSRDNRLVATRSVETTGVVLIKDFR